jgi:hypothetical protein
MKKIVARVVLPVLGIVVLFTASAVRSARAQPANGEKIVGGPYVVNATPTSATLMWMVQRGEASFGSAAGSLERKSPVLHAERIHLTGLKPGTLQHYQAFPGEAGKGSFKTPPAETTPFEFVVYGDTRTRHDVHRAVVAGILKYSHADFAVQTGDLVEDARDNALWPIFFDAERELLRKVAYYPALGNHERNAKNYYDYMEAQPYYSFDWGNAHLIVLNSDIGSIGPDKAARDAYWREQTRWLEDDLKSSQGAGFRFLFAHHPPLTAVKRRQGENPHMAALEPMFEKYRVSGAFFGHDHNYQHYRKNGIHYFVSGGGGAPLYDVDSPPAGITVKVASTENFMVVKVNGAKARVEVFKPTGEMLDSAELGNF